MTLGFDINTGKRSETGLVGILTQLGRMKALRGRIGGVLLRNTPPGKESFAKYRRMHF
jgi:hypothetical protein